MRRATILLAALGLFATWTDQARAAMSTADQTYYRDYFKTTSKYCALDCWFALYNATVQTDVNTYSLSQAQAMYATVRADLPVIQTRWDGTTLSLVSNPALEMALNIERCILVEVNNDVNATNSFVAYFNALPTISNTASAPPYVTRGLMTPCTISTQATTMNLRVNVNGAAKNLTIPITTVAAATITGTFYDDATGQPWPARAFVKCVDNQYRQTKSFEGVAHDINTVRQKPILAIWPSTSNLGNYKLPFSYSELNGTWTIDVPPGDTDVTLERGYEYNHATTTVTGLNPGDTRNVGLSAGRFVNMRASNWISGDTHVHWCVNAWNIDEDYGILDAVRKAEDVQVVNNLTLQEGRNQQFIAPDDYPPGPIAAYCDAEWHVQQAEEYRNEPFYGHVNMLNIETIVQPISTGSIMGVGAIDYPINSTQLTQALGQIPSHGGSPLITAAHGIAGEVAADIIRNRIQSIDQQVNLTDYYNILDSGLRIPLTTGADHPARLVGQTRCYVKIDGAFSYPSWIDGIRKMRTYVTSGPLLTFTVNGKDIGSDFCVNSGEILHIQATAVSRDPIGTFQIYSNGQVLQQKTGQGATSTIDFNYTATASRWIQARCTAGSGYDPIAEYGVAYTSPIYVIVNGARIYNSSKAGTWHTSLHSAGTNVYNNGVFATQAQRDEAKAVFDDGADAFDNLKYYPDFRASATTGQAPLSVTFTNPSTGSPSAWEWDFENDGTVDSTAQIPPAHVYSAPGAYTVKLRALYSGEWKQEVKTEYIKVSPPPPPVADFIVSPSTTGEASVTQFTFTDQSTGNPTAWAWDFGDGGTATGQGPQQHTYAAFGKYTVTLTASNAGGSDPEAKIDHMKISQTYVFEAIAADDGYIVESGEGTGVGGTVNGNRVQLYVGDDVSDSEIRSILSFDTAPLPTVGTVTAAFISLKKLAIAGTNPFTTHGACKVAVAGDFFNDNQALEAADFSATAARNQVATMTDPVQDPNSISKGDLAGYYSYIDRAAPTQFRVYFDSDNNDDGDDYVGFGSANNTTQANRPTLTVSMRPN